jgi:hypothetical protein
MMAEEESDYSDSEQEESEEEEEGGGEEEGVVGRSVTDKLYTPVPFHGDFSRPFGLKTALLIRGMRGGVIVLDTSGEQAYKPVKGRLSGEDYVCETCNLLWSLGDREAWLTGERKRTQRHSCPGYPNLRAHTGEHVFRKYDLLRLYLRHRLKLRITLAASKVTQFLFLERESPFLQ